MFAPITKEIGELKSGLTELITDPTDSTKQIRVPKNSLALPPVSGLTPSGAPLAITQGLSEELKPVCMLCGEPMPEGETMLRILHMDRRYIIVHLPTRRVNEMQPGHEVELLFPGRQLFRGEVVDVPMLADTTGQSGETLAAVRIDPVGRLWPTVPVGSQVDVISLK